MIKTIWKLKNLTIRRRISLILMYLFVRKDFNKLRAIYLSHMVPPRILEESLRDNTVHKIQMFNEQRAIEELEKEDKKDE